MCNRPFDNVDIMTDSIIDRNNQIVTDKDDIWDLGDFAYRCSSYQAYQCLSRLNGCRHIIMGNHDIPLRKAYKAGLLTGLIKSGKLEIIGGETAIFDNTLSISKMLTINGRKIFMSHYSCRTWPSAFRNSIMLYGHSHGNLPEPYCKSFDVGVDSHNFYPWSEDEIFSKVKDIGEHFE